MNKIGRPGRIEPVSRTTAYLTEPAIDAANEIRLLLPKTRDIRITTTSDAINVALVEYSHTLRTQYGEIVRKATGRVIG